jgi:predicted HTH transcriptional regulator
MDKKDRIRSRYLHACLRYVQRDYMTNTSLRSRFGIEEKNSSMVSRIISDALEAKVIIPYDDTASRKYKKYLPRWAK